MFREIPCFFVSNKPIDKKYEKQTYINLWNVLNE